MKLSSSLQVILILLAGCSAKKNADLIVTNARIYTVDSLLGNAQALAVRDGKFIAVGSTDEILKEYTSDSILDAANKPLYPGFLDAHSHFTGLAESLSNANLLGTKSMIEVIDRLKEFRKLNPYEPWILGAGWDQNDWPDKKFPNNSDLNRAFPNIPVFLRRIDGHAALASSKALEISGVKPGQNLEGGLVEIKNRKVTGILIDNAMDLVTRNIPLPTIERRVALLKAAEKECLATGLTTVSDAGINRNEIDLLDSLQKTGALKIREYAMAMATRANLQYYLKNGPTETDRLSVHSFKIVADGALGSRGACLLAPYSDSPIRGFLLSPPENIDQILSQIANSSFQANVHCIGDSANRLLLRLFKKHLKGPNDRRWRIEHAQVVTKADQQVFREASIVPSIQPTHATSDMYWAEDRLGKGRIKTAYAYKDLLDQAGFVALGSDFPVENVNPIYGFHAAVARVDSAGFPVGGFQMENALTRAQALKGMTIWAAKANFQEHNRGSIETGKWADFVILDRDIMEVQDNRLRGTKVLRTVVAGETVFLRR